MLYISDKRGIDEETIAKVNNLTILDCPDYAERIKRKVLRVRSDGSIPPYVTKAESRKQHSDAPLCNSLMRSLYIMCPPWISC